MDEAAADSGSVRDFLLGEEAALVGLRDALSRKEEIPGGERDARIRELLFGREYLFLHFPDGFEPSLERGFLTRVRAEIDFFIKDIRRALSLC
jgi:hypothetical protein